MKKKDPAPHEIAVKALWDARERMKAKCGGIGEPAVYLPTGDIRTFIDNEGEIQAIVGMTQFIYLVDTVLRSALAQRIPQETSAHD